jgi:hypothetical protein
MGSDGEPVSRFRWTAGRAYFHSVDAKQDIAVKGVSFARNQTPIACRRYSARSKSQ